MSLPVIDMGAERSSAVHDALQGMAMWKARYRRGVITRVYLHERLGIAPWQ